VKHFASPKFWTAYEALPQAVQCQFWTSQDSSRNAHRRERRTARSPTASVRRRRYRGVASGWVERTQYSAIASEFARRGKSANQCPALLTKIFRFTSDPNHFHSCAVLSSTRGRIAIVTDVGMGCGGRNGVRRERAGRNACCGRRSRVVLTPRRWRQVGGSHFCRRWWQTSPVTRESPEETVKTIAQGNAGCPGEPVVTTRVLSTLAHGLRVQRAPGFPCALS
jgi:hypothetical protein